MSTIITDVVYWVYNASIERGLNLMILNIEIL